MELRLLIQQFKSHKTEMQRQLYDLFYKRFYSLCWRYLGNEQDVEEQLCNGFLKIFEHIPNAKFETDAHFISWMKRIMVNECLMWLRKRKLHFAPLDDTDIDFQDTSDPLAKLSVAEIMQQIQQLPDGYRTVFNLYIFEQMSHKEISNALNISEQTSKSQLFKAKKALQNNLSQLGYGK